MKTLFRRAKEVKKNCKWEDSCICESGGSYIHKSIQCQDCKFYFFIDSGTGYCRALPEPVLVAWCKDICSLFLRILK